MTDIFALIADLQQKRITLQAINGQLKVEAPNEVLTDQLRKTITEHKAEIIAYLTPVLSPVVKKNTLTHSQPGKGFSAAQQHLWSLMQLQPQHGFYHVKHAFTIAGRLNQQALQTAFELLLQRHEILRCKIGFLDNEPRLVPDTETPFILQVQDLSYLTGQAQSVALGEALTSLLATPFNLETESPCRVAVFTLSPTKNLLIIVIHHMATDPWSSGVLRRELSQLYVHAKTGIPHSLPKLSLQYSDFAVWQQHWLTDELLHKQLSFWHKELQDLNPTLLIPTDFPRSTTVNLQAGMWVQDFDAEFLRTLRLFSRTHNVTVFMALMVALQILFYRLSNQNDFAIATPVTQRQRQDLENLVGYFVNPLLIRATFASDDTFLSLLGITRKRTIAALNYPHLPFNLLVEQLFPAHSHELTPLAQVFIAMQNQTNRKNNWGDVQVDTYNLPAPDIRYDLEIYIHEENGTLQLSWLYRKDLWTEASIQHWGKCLHTLLTHCIKSPNANITTLPLQAPEAEQRIMQQWSIGSVQLMSNHCPHQLFEQQALQTPDAVAVYFAQQTLTYRELNQKSNQLANHILTQNISIETPIALCLDHGLEALIALLAIFKSGCPMVALHPDLPVSQLNLLLTNSQPGLLISQLRLIDKLVAFNDVKLLLDQDLHAIQKQPVNAPERVVSLKNLALIHYTSTLQGVMIEHYALNNVLKALQKEVFKPRVGDMCLSLAPLSDDIALLEIFLPLISGASLLMTDAAATKDLEQLKHLIKSHPLKLMHADPSTYLGLSILGWVPEAGLTMFSSKGKLSRTLALSLLQPATKLWQLFGMPETTICSLAHNVNTHESTLLLGAPITNTEVFILDTQLQPVAIGIWGEMYIGGQGLAQGYLYNSELTQHNFIAHPFSKNPAARLFKSNVKARWLSEGHIEYAGRLHREESVRGQCINLSAIEDKLLLHPTIRQAVVTLEGESDNPILVAYYLAETTSGNEATLRQELSMQLADYLLPQQFIRLNSIPLTSAGTPDFHALSAYREAKAAAISISHHGLNETASKLLTLCAEIFKPIHAISLQDTFFSVGGSTIQAIRLIKAIKNTFAQSLPLATILHNTSFAQLVNLLDVNAKVSQPENVTDNVAGSHPAPEPTKEATNQSFKNAAETDAPLMEGVTNSTAQSASLANTLNEALPVPDPITLPEARQSNTSEVNANSKVEHHLATHVHEAVIKPAAESTSNSDSEHDRNETEATKTIEALELPHSFNVTSSTQDPLISAWMTDITTSEPTVAKEQATSIPNTTHVEDRIATPIVNNIPPDHVDNTDAHKTVLQEQAEQPVLIPAIDATVSIATQPNSEPTVQPSPSVPEQEAQQEDSNLRHKLLSYAGIGSAPRLSAQSLIHQYCEPSTLPAIYLCGGALEIAPHCSDLQIFGLETAFGLIPYTTENIRALAAEYVTEILTHNPEGPYRIGGYENGTHIAYEIAVKLQTLGKSVELLLLINQIIFQPYAGHVAFFVLQQNNLLRDLQHPGSTKILHKYFPHGWTIDIIPSQHASNLEYVDAMVLAERISARASRSYFKPLVKTAYQLHWELLEQTQDADTVTLTLKLKNTSSVNWPAGQLALGHHLQDLQGVLIQWSAASMALTENIPAGQSTTITYTLKKPIAQHNIFVLTDLLDKGNSWFSLQGAASSRVMINAQFPAHVIADLPQLANLSTQGKLQAAIAGYQMAIATDPEAQQTLVLNLARAYLQSGRSENAKTLLIHASENSASHAQNTELHLLLAEIYLLAGAFTDAITEVDLVLSQEENHSQALAVLGLANAHLGNILAAKQAFDRALAQYTAQPLPKQLTKQIDSFSFLLDKFNHPDCVKYAQLLIDDTPLNPFHQFNCAYFLFRRKHYRQAETMLLQAMALYPANTLFPNNLAKLYLEQEKFIEAANTYRQLSKLLPLKIDNFVMLAKIRIHLEQYQAASDILEQASKLDPEDASIAQCKADIKAAKHQHP